jgi:hypothetical protein
MDRPGRDADPQHILRWSWAKLRRVKLIEQDTREADALHREADAANEINYRNHLGEGIGAAMQRRAAGA